jgi:hypothetical protein
VLAAALPAGASAAVPRTYVDEATGSDTNDCSHSHPCLSFQHAHDVTTPGGEVVALSAGNYSSLTVTKPITIDGNNGQGTMTPFQYGVTVDLGAGGGTVVLRGLSINAVANSGVGGIDMVSGGTLITDNVRIVGGTVGIIAENSTNPFARLIIDDTKIQAVSGPGVAIQPSGPRAVRATIRDSKIDGNSAAGIRLQPTSGATARSTVRRTQLDGNLNGIVADATGGTAVANVIWSAITDSGLDAGSQGYGVDANGAKALIRISRSEIQTNLRGLLVLNSGRILSTGDNDIFGNSVDGAPTGTFARH